MPKNDTKLKDIIDKMAIKQLNQRLNHGSMSAVHEVHSSRKHNVKKDNSFNKVNHHKAQARKQNDKAHRGQKKQMQHDQHQEGPSL